jgi:hypothetical protein
MKNLGKIILFLFLIPHAVFGAVSASVDSHTVVLGDTVTLSLNISGSDVQRPNIQTLCDSDVTSSGSQTNIQMINGSYQKSYTLTYQFMPTKSCKIEPIELKIDGTTEKTEPINITVKPADTSRDAEFMLTLSSDKKEVLVGEPFDITLLFKQKNGAGAVDSNFVPPSLKGFWVKNESKPERYQEGDYTVTKVVYKVAAQRRGKLSVGKAQMKIATRVNSRDIFGSFLPQVKWRSYFSNELNFDVKPLPGGVDLIGTFTISAKADKSVINANEAVNVTIEVDGDGNLEDIKSFKPYIDGVNVFDEKIVINGSKLTQKLAFVADSDFAIPAFTIKSYDPKTKEIKTASTKEIKIKVKNAKPKTKLTIKRDEGEDLVQANLSQNRFNPYWTVLAFVVGLACGIILMFLKPWRYFEKKKTFSIKDTRVLLVKLLPYKNDEEVQKIIDILEKNIYSNEKVKLDKKTLKEIIKRYQIV